MYNPIVKKLLENAMLELNHNSINTSWELSELIYKAMTENKMKAEFHFSKEDGKLVFDKVLGRDVNNNFYNEVNGNLEERKEAIKTVIVTVLLSEYNK